MRTKQSLFIISIVLLAIFFINTSSRTKSVKTHKYVSIYFVPPHIKITEGYEHFSTVKLNKKEGKGDFDSREIFKLIEKYEKEGYQLVESNAFTAGGEFSNSNTYYLLRK